MKDAPGSPPLPKPDPRPSVRRTRRGWRIAQHGTVLSEVLLRPSPTHSVFDVLAAACMAGPSEPRDIALLGFGGGGVVAALRALGCAARIHAVDLDATGWKLLARSRVPWLQPLVWHHADAIEWLRKAGRFDAIVDDLSIPNDGDVVKPEFTWNLLPDLMRKHLRPRGRALFNLLRPVQGSWTRGIQAVSKRFGGGVAIHLEDFENRILAVGHPGAPLSNPRAQLHPRTFGSFLRAQLRSLGSRQEKRLRVEGIRRGTPRKRTRTRSVPRRSR